MSAPSVEHSLYRNGKVLTRRDPDGSDTALEGVVLEEREMVVHNGRLLRGSERRTNEQNGFELLSRPLARRDLDFFDHLEVVHNYYPECQEIVRENTGARTIS